MDSSLPNILQNCGVLIRPHFTPKRDPIGRAGVGKFSLTILLPALLVAAVASGDEITSAPMVPGLHGKHPLNERQVGEVLIDELRCAACHAGIETSSMKMAPDLRGVGARLVPDFIKKFVADPAHVHPGTTMPNLLDSIPALKREEMVDVVTAYLSSLKEVSTSEPVISGGTAAAGKELFYSIGCVACHSGPDDSGKELRKDGVVYLTHLGGKYQAGALAAFLQAPLKVRPSGRMPDMNLNKDEAASIAAYLEGNRPAEVEPQASDADRIAAGKRVFEANNCAACHRVDEQNPSATHPGPPLAQLDLTRGCMSDQPGMAPQFHLDASQKQSIRAALKESAKPEPAAERIKMRLTQMNCIACHTRDNFGGVAQSIDSYFHSTEETLGNEARIPPPLTKIGAKLRPEWLSAVLYDGRTVRPYMTTRMPQFGETGLAGLTHWLEEVDQMPALELPDPEKNLSRETRESALQMIGDKGLNCIACHNFNGKDGPGMKGIDIMTSYQRLQPAWFFSYMKNPAAFRPGIIMPSYWPEGKATRTDILNGDTDLQLTALYNYFSLGHSAGNPSGLRSEPSRLVVDDAVITYRGRSSIAGFRGIAVGFPGGMNYAFNAQNGALSAIWSGDFLRVNWQGQGAGDFNSVGTPLQLAQDVAFLQSSEPPDPWPLRPITTKEQPVNPDPLYPHNHGYQFGGYSLDEKNASVPTFDYRCGPVLIHDRSLASEGNGTKVLKREFHFVSPAAETIWFRALAGNIEAESKTVFKIPGLRLTITPTDTLLRPTPDGGKELLIKLPLAKGESNYTLDYELLR